VDIACRYPPGPIQHLSFFLRCQQVLLLLVLFARAFFVSPAPSSVVQMKREVV
jgi:hypothetical protein